ncbi:hypothetical protein [Sulfuracidifex tepidarius]|uniref:hypothetical protein n=1 Tax=Sulfuracidifex tepidarius TaxID=1294262 RepID=UPI0006CFD55C|nr:hypothetical protein [Sulfuracidifex tepidarius]
MSVPLITERIGLVEFSLVSVKAPFIKIILKRKITMCYMVEDVTLDNREEEGKSLFSRKESDNRWRA